MALNTRYVNNIPPPFTEYIFYIFFLAISQDNFSYGLRKKIYFFIFFHNIN